MPIPVLLTTSLFLSTLLMTVTFLIARRMNNYSIVDVAWAAGFLPLAIYYAVGAEGFVPRKIIFTLMMGLWSYRLGGFLYARIKKHHPVEDTRYQQLRKEWSSSLEKKFFWFYQAQAVVLWALSIPAALVSVNVSTEISMIEWIGVLVWTIAFVGESVADRQAARFKEDPLNKGKVCQLGLWSYSRHPNYFFESFIWWGYFIFAMSSPAGWITVYCPLLILWLLLKVTGIPFAEEQSLKSRGDAYREYQRTTSAFIPWFKKS